jgi:hypothetical protein
VREEVLCATEEPIAPLTRVRSTLLSSSFLSLKEHGLESRYLANLPPQYHETIRFTPAGVWLALEVARAHYTACDALGLSEAELRGMGGAVAKLAAKSMLQMAVRAAGAAGVDPWIVLSTNARYWARFYEGSGVRLVKTAPKDGRLDVMGNPLLSFQYCRVAFAGIVHSLAAPFCRTIYVNEIAVRHGPDRASYSIVWA